MSPILRPVGISEAALRAPNAPDGHDAVRAARNVRASPRDAGRVDVTGGSDGGPPIGVGVLLLVVALLGGLVHGRRRE